jgi:hypothetical protein
VGIFSGFLRGQKEGQKRWAGKDGARAGVDAVAVAFSIRGLKLLVLVDEALSCLAA